MSKKNRNGTPVEAEPSGETDNATGRRDLLKTAVAAGIGVCAVGTPICAGARMTLAPVFQEARAGKFYPLVAVDTLTEKPQKFHVVDDKQDAWTTLPDQKIGSLYLRKAGDRIVALHSLCPHAGCMIQAGVKKNPKSGADEEMFYCPCHAAHFDLDGKRLDGVAPRDLDALDTKVENGIVCVKFENFTFGIAEKRGS